MVAEAEETLSELDPELLRTLRIEPATVAELAQTIMRSPASTIEPANRSDSSGSRAVDALPTGITSGLDMEATIGQGGMGIVRLATQRSLGRKVAVKTLRPEARTTVATLRLLREAWVTGSLEHPNIVPVYDLGLDEDGSPIIVLKKIEGVEWAELLRSASVVEQRFGAKDLLEWNLRILVQLCNAVSLAHTRRIVHRDLKPENVMIGGFGEVYLVDWGIAVSLDPDPEGRLPVVKGPADIAGTPCYMAPEMVGALGTISERTDVYLLGAILHEVLTGEPPHRGSFNQIMGSILLSAFRFGDSIPSELAQIAQKAMAREPEARFASAEELRKAIEHYLQRRGSLRLSAEADKRLASMRALVESSGEREAIYRLASEARFGFRQALEASPDNEDARRGLRETIERLVRFELERGTAAGAAAALAELHDPPAELTDRVARAREAEAARLARLERLEADLDPQAGRRTRLTVGLLVVACWSIAPLLGPIGERMVAPPSTYRLLYLTMGVISAAMHSFAYWGRESLSKTRINRDGQSIVMLGMATGLLVEVGCWVLRVPFDTMVVLHFAVWFQAAASITIHVDRRMWGSVLAYFVGFLAACKWPSWKWQITSLTNVGVGATLIYAWAKFDEDRPAKLREHIKQQRLKNRSKP